MYIELKSGKIEKKTGEYYLSYHSDYGLSLFVILGRDVLDYFVSYYVDGIKCYKDGTKVYVDVNSLQRALNVNIYESSIEKLDIDVMKRLNTKYCYSIPENSRVNKLNIEDLKLWYLKSRVVNSLPEIVFDADSILSRIPVVKTKDLEVGKTYISKEKHLHLYIGYYNGLYVFYKQALTEKFPNFYKEKRLEITQLGLNRNAYFFGYKTIPDLYEISDFPKSLIPSYILGHLECLQKIDVCVK